MQNTHSLHTHTRTPLLLPLISSIQSIFFLYGWSQYCLHVLGCFPYRQFSICNVTYALHHKYMSVCGECHMWVCECVSGSAIVENIEKHLRKIKIRHTLVCAKWIWFCVIWKCMRLLLRQLLLAAVDAAFRKFSYAIYQKCWAVIYPIQCV